MTRPTDPSVGSEIDADGKELAKELNALPA